MANQHFIPAEFNGTSLNIIDRDGQKWLTAEEVGHCLGYDESNARKGVVKLYERHGDEFSEADSRVVNLTSRDGKPRPSRIFSATGCIKLGFFTNTPRAKDFRAWASKVLAGQPAPVVQPTQAKNVERILHHLQSELLIARPDWQALQRYHAAGLTPTEMGKLIGKSAGAVRHLLLRMHAAGLLDYRPSRVFSAAGHKGKQVQQAQQLALGV